MSTTEAPLNLTSDVFARRMANKDASKRKHLQQLAQAVVKPLAKNGFQPIYVEGREQAKEEILKLVPLGATVGLGGSMTMREIGVLEELANRDHVIYNHWRPDLSKEEILEIRHAHLSCDVFLTSTNALTLQGQIVSTDGAGNRISAMIFGPKRVVIVVGANKIVKDLEAALARIKDICTPRLMSGSGERLPCVATGICNDCDSPARVCRATIILDRQPTLTETFVLLVGEELGI